MRRCEAAATPGRRPPLWHRACFHSRCWQALARSAGENGRGGASQVGAALEPGEDQPRQTVMTRMPGRTAQVQAAITVFALMAVAITACDTSQPSSRTAIPAEFKAACGHPGAHVRVRKVPVTVRHADCKSHRCRHHLPALWRGRRPQRRHLGRHQQWLHLDRPSRHPGCDHQRDGPAR